MYPTKMCSATQTDKCSIELFIAMHLSHSKVIKIEAKSFLGSKSDPPYCVNRKSYIFHPFFYLYLISGIFWQNKLKLLDLSHQASIVN